MHQGRSNKGGSSTERRNARDNLDGNIDLVLGGNGIAKSCQGIDARVARAHQNRGNAAVGTVKRSQDALFFLPHTTWIEGFPDTPGLWEEGEVGGVAIDGMGVFNGCLGKRWDEIGISWTYADKGECRHAIGPARARVRV